MKKIRPATDFEVSHAKHAREALRKAVYHLAQADCPKTLERARAALSSAQGAVRHVMRRRRDSAA